MIHGFRGREGKGVLVGVILSTVVTMPHATCLWINFPCITPLQRMSRVGGVELRGRGMATTTECEPTGRVTAAVVVEISDGTLTVGTGVARVAHVCFHSDQLVLVQVMFLSQEASSAKVKITLGAVEENIQSASMGKVAVAAVTLPAVVDTVLQPGINRLERVAM